MPLPTGARGQAGGKGVVECCCAMLGTLSLSVSLLMLRSACCALCVVSEAIKE